MRDQRREAATLRIRTEDVRDKLDPIGHPDLNTGVSRDRVRRFGLFARDRWFVERILRTGLRLYRPAGVSVQLKHNQTSKILLAGWTCA
jgi:hypothetical protein